MDATRPIGIFDSGIGGLTVAKAIQEALPNEHIVYFGDTAHLPYGDKSLDTIYEYSKEITDFLISQNCKMIVIACNSASSAAYDKLVAEYRDANVTFVNVIDPMVDFALTKKYRKVGVIATKATINSSVFEKKIYLKDQSVDVKTLATPLLAPMIEEGFYNGKISQAIIDNYLNKPMFSDIDTLLLACTHYPLIHKEIQSYLGKTIDVVDASELVADVIEEKLQQKGLLCTQKEKADVFFVSDYTVAFEQTAKMFYGTEVSLKIKHL